VPARRGIDRFALASGSTRQLKFPSFIIVWAVGALFAVAIQFNISTIEFDVLNSIGMIYVI
jgi:hypothetical protein